MNFITIYKKFFQILFYPRYWIYDSSHPYCKEFDEWMIKKLKEGHVPTYCVGSDCNVNFAGRILWKWSYGPSDFSLFEIGYDKVRASRLTNIKMYKLLKNVEKSNGYKWRKDE